MTLKVLKGPGDLLETETVKVFDEDGGTIGRSPDCDWVLPDPECFVSGNHASILCQNGDYYLIDTSSNGTFLNNMPQPIPTGEPLLLTHDDYIGFGSYKVVVSLDNKDAQRAKDNAFDISTILIDDNSLGNAKAQQVIDEVEANSLTTGGDESEPTGSWAMLDLDQLEQAADSDEPEQEAKATPPVGRQAEKTKARFEAASDTAISQLEVEEPVPSRHKPSTRPVPAPEPKQEIARQAATQAAKKPASVTELNPTRSVSAQTSAAAKMMPAHGDYDQMIAAFARGAGISPDEIPNRPPQELMEVIGRLFAEMLSGMQQLLQSRAALKDQFRLGQTMMKPSSNNPIKFSSGVEDSLPRLLSGRKGNYKKSADAVRECYHDVNADFEAMNEAMRRGLFEYLKMFDPDTLQEHFEHVMGKNKFLGGNKRRYWDLYADNYRTITQHAEGRLPEGFSKAFVNAFENAVAKRSYKKLSDT